MLENIFVICLFSCATHSIFNLVVCNSSAITALSIKLILSFKIIFRCLPQVFDSHFAPYLSHFIRSLRSLFSRANLEERFMVIVTWKDYSIDIFVLFSNSWILCPSKIAVKCRATRMSVFTLARYSFECKGLDEVFLTITYLRSFCWNLFFRFSFITAHSKYDSICILEFTYFIQRGITNCDTTFSSSTNYK